jgi:hypothetical protein
LATIAQPARLFSLAASGKGKRMEDFRVEELRSELDQLLKKQADVLESRSLGTASETEMLEYELRQEVVHQICNELARSISS